MMIEITRSQIDTFLRCRKKYDYAYIQKIEGGKSNAAMSQGTLIHYGLEAGYKAFADLQKTTDHHKESVVQTFIEAGMAAMAKMALAGVSLYRGEEQPLVLDDEAITRIGDVFQYYAQQKAWEDFNRYEIIAVEYDFAYEIEILGETVRRAGKIDLLARDRSFENKRMATIFDHKSTSAISEDMSFLSADLQMLNYEHIVAQVLVNQLGTFDDVQIEYNMIRREVPPGFGHRELKRNKDGSVSKTNASTDPADYLKRVNLFHSKRQRDAVESNFLLPSLEEMIEMRQKEKPRYLRTNIRFGPEACANCVYFAQCGAEAVGAGVPKFVKKSSEASSTA